MTADYSSAVNVVRGSHHRVVSFSPTGGYESLDIGYRCAMGSWLQTKTLGYVARHVFTRNTEQPSFGGR
jgi:hypothetical protein